MTTVEPAPTEARRSAPATLDEMMLAMDVVDTLRHRERLIERELNEDVREEQLIERLRALYKSQGIDVPDRIIAEGVKALKEARFVYTPPPAGWRRTLAELWVKRTTYLKRSAVVAGAVVVLAALYQYAVVRPREQAAEAARLELTQTLPRQLGAAYQAVIGEALVPEARAGRRDPRAGAGRARTRRCRRSAIGDRRSRCARRRAATGIHLADRRPTAGSDRLLPRASPLPGSGVFHRGRRRRSPGPSGPSADPQ
jgi:hypothetical protein